MTSDEIINFLEYSGNADSALGRTETSDLKRQAAALIRRLRDERDVALERVKGFANGNNDWRIAYNKLAMERDEALAKAERQWEGWIKADCAAKEARNKALDEAAERAGSLLGYYDGKAIAAAILALKEPKP
jgi:hypothetical protein